MISVSFYTLQRRFQPRLPQTKTSARLTPVAAIIVFGLGLFVAPGFAAQSASAEPNVCQGLIEPSATVTFSAPVAGRLEDVPVDRGDRVKKGQVIIRFDASVETANVQLEKVRAAAEAKKLSAQGVLVQRTIELNKKEKLFSDGILSDTDILEARTLKRIAEANAQDAEEEQKTAAMELKRAVELLNQRSVASTVDGVVLKRFRRAGESVQVPDPILTVVKLDPLWVEVFCAKEMFGKIRVGQSAEITPEPPHAGRYRAKVIVVDPIVEATSSTFGVRLELINPEEKIAAGIRCKLRFLP